MKIRKILALVIVTAGFGSTVNAQKTLMLRCAAMYTSKNIVENAVNSKDHTTHENEAWKKNKLFLYIKIPLDFCRRKGYPLQPAELK